MFAESFTKGGEIALSGRHILMKTRSRLERAISSAFSLITLAGLLTAIPSFGVDCVAPPTGLIGWWKGEGNGADEIGLDHAVLHGATFTNGMVGLAFDLAKGGHARIKDTPYLQTTHTLTLEAWVFPRAQQDQGIVCKWDGSGSLGNKSYSFALSADGRGYFLASPGGPAPAAVAWSTNIIPLNAWTHVAGTYDGSALRFYVNGFLHSVVAFTNGIATSPSDIGIGGVVGMIGEGSVVAPFDGLIDEPAIYRASLSAERINEIWKAGQFGKCPKQGLAPRIVRGPMDQTVAQGMDATFSVEATGPGRLLYRWIRNNQTGPELGTNATLTLTNVQPAQAGIYGVWVNNAFGSAYATARLTVTPAPVTRLRIVDTIAMPGQLARVPIELVAQGAENALGFSVSFAPNRLSYAGLDTTGLDVMVNTNLIGSGLVGILVAKPVDGHFAAGTQIVARVSFSAASSNYPVTTSVSFGANPVAKLVVDAQGNPMNAEYLGGFVTLFAGYEADVAPRPGGDTNMNVADWVILGRMAAGRIQAAPGIDFMKADCAPRSSLGDGRITVSDWVQAGRYASAMDPLTPAGGPATPIKGLITPSSARKLSGASRAITATCAGMRPGSEGAVSVMMAARGGENALGFSLKFDPAALEYQSASLAGGTGDMALELNDAHASEGRLGAVMALPAGRGFEAGARPLLRLAFRAGASIQTNTLVAFADDPVAREMCDTLAEPLPATFLDADVRIDPRPALAIGMENGRMTLRWPAWAADCALESASGVSSRDWSAVPGRPVVSPDYCTMELPLPGEARFFRLRQR